MDREIMVSVICNAYNHEKYIASALEGFVMQKTDFPFEVLVHDDASNDATADIIRSYAERYPELIFPIYQQENQYSRGGAISRRFQFPRARGKYIALCEGDDYWTDPCKLQKQFDAMERHPEVDMCAHATSVESNGSIVAATSRAEQERVFSLAEVIDGGGSFVSTASVFYRKTLEEGEYPPFRQITSFDYVMQIHGALRGGLLYLPDTMAVYRRATENSWTVRMRKDTGKSAQHRRKVAAMLSQLDVDTRYRYTDIIQKKLRAVTFHLNYLEGNYRALLSREYKEEFRKKTVKKRLYILVKAALSFLTKPKQ